MRNQQFVVSAGNDVQVLVRARMKGDSEGGTSGQPLQFLVSGQTSGNVMTIRARGLASSTDLTANNGDNSGQGEVVIGRSTFGANADVFGPRSVSVMSKIVTVANANTVPNGTAIPTGSADFGQFAFNTAHHTNAKNGLNSVVLKNLLFAVNASNVSVDSATFRLARRDNSSIEHTCSVTDNSGTPLTGTVNGSLRVFCQNLDSSAIGTTIDRGESAIFHLRATIVNPALGGKSGTLQASLQSLTDAGKTAFGIGSSAIEWIDSDAQTAQTFFWIDQTETLCDLSSGQSLSS